MSNNNTSTSSGGISVFGLLGTAFVFCKLAGVTEIATWPWIWVLAPFWGGLAFILGIIFIAVILKASFN